MQANARPTNSSPYTPPVYTPGAVPSVEPIKVVAAVLQSEMGLKDGQIMLSMENWVIPEDLNMYIALSYGVEQVIGNNNYNSTDDDGNYYEIQDVAMLHQIEIDIMSFSDLARTQKEGILWAIKSYNAEQAMEKYQMRLAYTPNSFLLINSLEPSKQLNRFRLTIGVNALHRNVKLTPYYDSLQPVELVENP